MRRSTSSEPITDAATATQLMPTAKWASSASTTSTNFLEVTRRS